MSTSAAAGQSSENDRLLVAARAGDGAAFGRLAEEYRPYLKTVGKRILAYCLPSDGSDVVQTGLAVAGWTAWKGPLRAHNSNARWASSSRRARSMC
jgi:hypothetical protein